MMPFILSPVANFQGNTSQGIRKAVNKGDEPECVYNFNTLHRL